MAWKSWESFPGVVRVRFVQATERAAWAGDIISATGDIWSLRVVVERTNFGWEIVVALTE
jgi:hypothetical protein